MMLFDDLLSELLPDVPNCPDALALKALRNAAIEFCTKTHAWNVLLTSFPLVDLTQTYAITSQGDGSRAVAALWGWCNGREVRAKALSEIIAAMPDWQTALGPTPIYLNQQAGADGVTLYPKPMNSNGALLQLRVAFAPGLTSTGVPDAVGNDYFQSLVAGAKANLMLTQGKAWSNPSLGAVWAQKFANDMVETRIRVLHDSSAGSLTVQAPPFGFG